MSDRSLIGRIQETAQDDPNKVAISCGSIGDVTFADFLSSSKRIVEKLPVDSTGQEQRIVIFMRRSVGFVIAMHAVLMSRSAYVPIYHGTPLDRLKVLLEDCAPSAAICDEKTSGALREALQSLACEIPVIEIDSRSLVSVGQSPIEQSSTGWVSTDSNFSILYTSGSTGVPKGVMLTHGNLWHYINWAIDYFEIGRSDTVLSTAPFHFDMSSFDVYVSLAVGARLVIASEKECIFPKILVKRMVEEGVTVWKGVSPLVSSIAQSVDLNRVDLRALRTLIFAGERLPARDLNVWTKAHTNVSYFNGYGPTEATGVSCCYEIQNSLDNSDVIPIGQGRVDNEVLLFDGDNQVTDIDHPGEIVISGPGVAKGYWGDIANTDSKFVRQIGSLRFESPVYRTGDMGYFDASGDLVFAGRVDRQIKYQGYRIELDDIEAQLHRMPGVSGAAVVHRPDAPNRGLVLFFEGTEGIDAGEVRVYLSSKLPAYMVPKHIERVSAIPRTDRGKTDYQALVRLSA